ncbi:hypothetical protein H072_727 [Dactylellina haptotyla CBS 200.50]|uniref:Uncharacterized protein n=1 Tax=Dactylellina haptotyla (strain CBS 200.50) TaxID=1284197 RepID=S8AQM7_DACHA|nr:hypothetical protein H072_727 [Dactylellina haptotyla CBS 200.50]
MPPEEIWQTRRLERGGVICEIDELTYEARSLSLDCNACLDARNKGGNLSASSESDSDHQKKNNNGDHVTKEPGAKGGKKPRRKPSGSSPKGVNKRQQRVSDAKSKATPATRSAMGLRKLELQSESSPSSSSGSGSDASKKMGRRRKGKAKGAGSKGEQTGGTGELDTVEERVWKHLRSRPVGNI